MTNRHFLLLFCLGLSGCVVHNSEPASSVFGDTNSGIINQSISNADVGITRVLDSGALLATTVYNNKSSNSIPNIVVKQKCRLRPTDILNGSIVLGPGTYKVDRVIPGNPATYLSAPVAIMPPGGAGWHGFPFAVYANGTISPKQYQYLNIGLVPMNGTFSPGPGCVVTVSNNTTIANNFATNIDYMGRNRNGLLKFSAYSDTNSSLIHTVLIPAQPGSYQIFNVPVTILSVSRYKVRLVVTSSGSQQHF
jgi:hypothetical protein